MEFLKNYFIHFQHILALHKRVLGYADPLTAGQLRTVQVFVGSFRPPDANLVGMKYGINLCAKIYTVIYGKIW